MSDNFPTTDDKTRFAIAMLAAFSQQYSNANPGAQGTPALSTLNDITTRLAALKPTTINTWNVVWGPAIFSHDDSGNADNTMYVAQQEGTNNYIVSIGGTNFSGGFFTYDFIDEDLGVFATVPWIPGFPLSVGATISTGTLLGLANILNTPAAEGTPQAGVKLVDFLSAQSKHGPLNINVTGHSLGGALAPTLATFLANTKGEWDKAIISLVNTMPVAGPTPGNDAFAKFVNGTMPFSMGYYNSLDVVPHVWASSDLSNVAGIYGDAYIVEGFVVEAAVLLVEPLIQGFNYTATARTQLTGTFQSGLTYQKQVGYQHVYGYDSLFQIDPGQALLLHPPPQQDESFQISQKLADAVKKAGHTVPSNLQIVPDPVTQDLKVGKTTFKVPASANLDRIRKNLEAIAPFFGDALTG